MLASDLDEIVERSESDLAALRGGRMLITGGTGFVGTWLVRALMHANARLGTRIRAAVVTRDPERFRAAQPLVAADPQVEALAGDVRRPEAFARAGTFDAAVHAATAADAARNAAEPYALLETVVDGTRFALEAAARNGRIPFLLTSSGAVYGRQPPDLERVGEAYGGGPDQLDTRFVYHETKRVAELLCALAAETGARATIARLFAFAGPFLPIDRHFAIGNFMRDALADSPLVVSGDGTPVRSYLYAGDLVSWLLRILVSGTPGRAYNVGAERAVSIAETAALVAAAWETPPAVEVRGTKRDGARPERYVPSTARARDELGLDAWTSLEDGIARWRRAYVGSGS